MEKKKEYNPVVQWAKFIVVLILYLLFLYWVKSSWGLLVVPFIFDVYIILVVLASYLNPFYEIILQ